jgi:Fe-S-cluster containining protein
VRKEDAGLERADARLTAFVDGILKHAAKRSGAHLACRPGCAECCLGPFPITRLDAFRLRRGLEDLASRDAWRASRLVRRARRAAAILGVDLPAGDGDELLSSDGASSEAFYRRHEALPCPVLDPETLRCELYAWRPVSCRTFGPPVRVEGVPLPPCRLCFTGATRRTIEACRVDVECGELESTLLERLESRTGIAGETLVAFALARTVAGP